jgi:hypothetical protein
MCVLASGEVEGLFIEQVLASDVIFHSIASLGQGCICDFGHSLLLILLLGRSQVIRSQDQCGNHADTNDGRRHGITCQIAELILGFSSEDQFVRWDALQGERFDADQRSSSVGDVWNHRWCHAWHNTRTLC